MRRDLAMMADKLRAFIINELHWDPSLGELTDDFPLIESSAVQSLGLYQLVSFIEREFQVEVLDDELLPEHFSSINAIVQLVDSKSARRGGA
jgi:acyl carrier protein